MKKILLSLLTIGLLTGCSSKSETNDISNDNEQTTSSDETNHNVKLPTMYEVDQSQKLELKIGNYYMYKPTALGVCLDRTGAMYFDFYNKNKNEIAVQLLSIELLDFEKEKYKNVTDIGKDDSLIFKGRDIQLIEIEKGFSKLDYQTNPISTNLDGKEAILNKGVAYEVSNKDKTLNYAMFDFFLDEEKNYPCEVILTSSDGVSADDLEAMARELIGTIQS